MFLSLLNVIQTKSLSFQERDVGFVDFADINKFPQVSPSIIYDGTFL